jgi:hypothetical protein
MLRVAPEGYAPTESTVLESGKKEVEVRVKSGKVQTP